MRVVEEKATVLDPWCLYLFVWENKCQCSMVRRGCVKIIAGLDAAPLEAAPVEASVVHDSLHSVDESILQSVHSFKYVLDAVSWS